MGTAQTSTSRTRTVALANRVVSADTITALHQFALDLAARLDLNDILARALLTAAQLTSSPHATLLLLDVAGDRVCYRVALDNGNLAPLELVAGPMMQKGLAGWVVRERRAALVYDTEHDPRWLPGPGLGDLRAALVLPLLHADRVLGVLTLGHESVDHYHTGHLNLIEIIGAQTALAIEYAQLAEQFRQAPAKAPGPLLPNPQPTAYDTAVLSAGLRGLSAAIDALAAQPGFDDVLSSFFQTAALIVDRHGGTIASVDDDTFVALFYTPGDPPRQAVLAAHELRTTTQRLRERWQARHGIRLGALDGGIVMGMVTVGTLDLLRPIVHAVGAPLAQARRLRELARGELFASERVALALSADPLFAFEALQPLELRNGMTQPIFRIALR